VRSSGDTITVALPALIATCRPCRSTDAITNAGDISLRAGFEYPGSEKRYARTAGMNDLAREDISTATGHSPRRHQWPGSGTGRFTGRGRMAWKHQGEPAREAVDRASRQDARSSL
jgi:hypothetical protein